MHDNNYSMEFGHDICVIQDCATKEVKGVGKAQGGFFYLLEAPTKKIVEEVEKKSQFLVWRRYKSKVVSRSVNVN